MQDSGIAAFTIHEFQLCTIIRSMDACNGVSQYDNEVRPAESFSSPNEYVEIVRYCLRQ